ncbi:MAG: XrtA system polysaccharide deacetylase [Candidatus Limnocylindrales bacterium]
MDNVITIDVEDWFHILDIPSAPQIDVWPTLPSRVERNLNVLLDDLDRHHVFATCFFLGWVAERFPHLVREAAGRGHEIASHGYAHQLVYDAGRRGFREDIRRSKSIIEGLTGRAVLGYRAPGFSFVPATPWVFDELHDAGFTYDSSVFPASRGHGGMRTADVRPWRVTVAAGEVVELPISVVSVLGRRVCLFGGGYLRLFPSWVIRWGARRLGAEDRPVVFYVHPREIDPDHPRLPMGRMRAFKSYVNLGTTRDKLEAILSSVPLMTCERWIDAHRAELPAGPFIDA